MATQADMTVEATTKLGSTKFVMYGEDYRTGPRKWYERYFDSVEKAVNAARKQGWTVDLVKRSNGIVRERTRISN